MDFLDQLNPQQRAAAENTEGPTLILAGAGSGKTRVITFRIAYLIDYRGVPADTILAVTFTNKSADEMRGRVERLVRLSGFARPWISTFHSFCVRLLREDGHRIGLPNDFSIYDANDQLSVVKKCLRQAGIPEREVKARVVLSRISYAKNHDLAAEATFEAASDPLAERIAVIYDLYTKALRQSQAVDFDDLLLLGVRLLREDAEAAQKYNARFQYILVDEFQDTNRSQYDLVRLLTQTHQNLCVVGDEDQSIYSWRGADIRNIVEFEQDYPDTLVIRLEENYRSTQNILDAAAAVVANNQYRKGKTLWTSRQGGEKIGFYEGPDGENESLYVADRIAKLRQQDPETRVAILYRTNSQSRLYEESLRRYGMKYTVVGGISFYERAEVKDLLAYLKAAANLKDSVSLIRIINSPTRGIGSTTVRKLEEIALEAGVPFWKAIDLAIEKQLLPKRALAALADFSELMNDLNQMVGEASVPAILTALIERTKYIETLEQEGSPEAYSRIENIQEFLNAAADSRDRGETLSGFLDHAALVSDADSFDESSEITLMTLHSAKGLEFPVVFLGGMEEGLLPHSRSLNDTRSLEEERRLCYVGMTRAEDALILTRARFRRHYGKQMPEMSAPSRFLSEIPAQLIDNLSPALPPSNERVYDYQMGDGDSSPRKGGSASNIRRYFRISDDTGAIEDSDDAGGPASFRPGNRVRHPRYGYGTVLRLEGSGENTKLTVSFPGVGLKKLLQKFAKLERL